MARRPSLVVAQCPTATLEVVVRAGQVRYVVAVEQLVPHVVESGAIGRGMDGLLAARQQDAWASSESRLGRWEQQPQHTILGLADLIVVVPIL